MPRETHSRQRQTRERIAQLAARLIAEDGIDDWGLAKKKAARTLGLAEAHCLPTNVELEAALLEHQRIFDEDGQREVLHWLRSQALDLIDLFQRFDPHLAGPVLSGAIGKYPTIHLHLFTDDEKAIELFLLKEAVPYDPSQRRVFISGVASIVPCFELNVEGTDVHLLQFSGGHRHQPVRLTAEGRPMARAGRASLAAKLDETAAPEPLHDWR
ncbi:MAG: hypothetical protein K2W80_01155 [Burkholderiales bacterium]|nr:hypothetical protein [Burkholderiales bacterium]